MPGRNGATPVYDVLGVGFGPSNLALAIAIDDHNRAGAADRLSSVFLERQLRFGWHRGMLIEGAQMRVAFLKDLVTLRNCSSRFTFISYLHSKNRLVDFINNKTFFPTRLEFHDYLEWVAAAFDDIARYGMEVEAIKPAWYRGTVPQFDIAARRGDGATVRYRARNVVMALGLEPRLPAGAVLSDHVWHNHDLVQRVTAYSGRNPVRCVVVGAGQSAAESVEYLHRRFTGAEVCAVISRYGYSQTDDSAFANRIYDPEAVDLFYGSSDEVRASLLDYHRNTNYSVVDVDLIDDLYARAYQEKVGDAERLRMMGACRVVDVDDGPRDAVVTVKHLPTGTLTRLAADIVVFATGYRPCNPAEILGELSDLCPRDDSGQLQVTREHQVVTEPAVSAGLYIQGGMEHSHGISSTLLSNVAVRAGEVVASLARWPEVGEGTSDRAAQYA